MRKNDLDKILIIEEDSFGTPWSKDAFLHELENQYAYYLVALINNNIVGYIGAWLIFDEAHITTLAIIKDFKRRGLATHILEEFFKNVRKKSISKATLEVRVSNIAARSLYSKEGFIEVGLRKKYYSNNNEDALIMWKEL